MEESEKELQDYFINLLIDNGYEEVSIKNEDGLIQNFKEQLKLFNKGVDFNFNRVLSYLYQGDRDLKFDKLRNSFDGIKFIDFSDFSNNIFQVSQEISVVGDYINRYDVTILINGLPLVQIELKKSGVGLREAFNQIQRYSNHSYCRLFDLVQIFIISNKVNTKYFFNDSTFNYNLACNWGDFKDLKSFTNSFLIKENLMKVLSEYIFKDYFTNSYQMLRHYQIDAIEGILDRINAGEDGYVWMSSNTGKLTTSFRLAEILKGKYPVIYVATEYLERYPESFVTQNNREFLHAINSQDLIITNIRSILAKPENLEEIRGGKYVFIFNEYERHSQRYTPDKLMKVFTNSLFYCFTSAPVFDENVIDDRTTKSFFSNQISTYSLRDALRDKTNLIIDCEYLGDGDVTSDHDLSSDSRIERISEYVIENAEAQSLLIVPSNDDLIRYQEHLKRSELKFVAVLRHDSNDIFNSKPMRDYFEEFICDYNRNFNADVRHRKVVDTTGISRDFELDVIKRFNNGEIELLAVDEGVFYDRYRINLLRNLNKLSLNAIFLDCNLNYDMLFEALMMVSGTDFSHEKSANVRIFRDIRKNIKQTVKLYSNNHASENITLKDYNHYLDRYNHYKSNINEDFTGNFKKMAKYHDILTSFDEFEFTKSENDEYNSLKDRYEHMVYEMNANKKIITSYDLKLIDEFCIDLNYIDHEDEDDKTQDMHETGTLNISNETNTNILSLQSNDNSKSLSIVNNNHELSNNINVKNEYHIHIGGDNIQRIDEEIPQWGKIEKENEKICLTCQELYPEEFNYCPDHEELVYVKDLTKTCKACNGKFPEEYNYCPNCDSKDQLVHIYNASKIIEIETNPNKYFNYHDYPNRYGEIEDLLSEKNYKRISEYNLSQIEFDDIINNIKIVSVNVFNDLVETYHIDYDSLPILDKILLFSKSFVKTDYKEGGGDLGYYKYNEIYIDDRATNAFQITTILHELSHFLLAEIFEQVMSLMLDCEKTDALEAFVCYMLFNDDFNYLVDEYCAHTVEGRFATYGYQDFGSYKVVLSNCSQKYSSDLVEIAKSIGNTFANYIKDIMTSYIDYKLREEIKEEFTKINDIPNYPEVGFETTSTLNWEGFSRAINLMIEHNIKNLFQNPQDMNQLKEYAIKFKINNQE